MTHREINNEIVTIIPLEVELLDDNDYKIDLEDYELKSDNYTIQIKQGDAHKELIYFNRGSYFEQDDSEFTEMEVEITHIKVFNKQDEEVELTDAQHLRLCDYIRVHKIVE